MKFLKKLFRTSLITKSRGTSVYPPNVLIEVTNACNLRCRMCFIWGEGVSRHREIGFVGEKIWKAAIDEMGSWPISATLDLHGAGEPLLHPDFFQIAEYAKSKGNISVGFLSNATLLDEEKAKAMGFFSEHSGKTYYFSSEESKKKFEKDPKPYVKK